MILVIDNYDSFVHNLTRYIRQLCSDDVVVVRNDELDHDNDARAVVISPGPCGPVQAGDCLDFVRANYQRLPMLGVCLGHQIIVEALGGTVLEHSKPIHGKASNVFHDQTKLFENVPTPFQAGRYHSLICLLYTSDAADE